MIRTLHHMAEPEQALAQVYKVMAPEGVFILEFANKRNLKAMLRYLFGKQSWSPYTRDPVEFADLNFDFHPKAVRGYLAKVGFACTQTALACQVAGRFGFPPPVDRGLCSGQPQCVHPQYHTQGG